MKNDLMEGGRPHPPQQDSDVPTNLVSYAKVLPDDFAQYIHTGVNLPVVCLNHEKKALVRDISILPALSAVPDPGRSLRVNTKWPENSMRLAFNELILTGASGNPCFMFINHQPVILTVWTSGGSGSSVHSYKQDINILMNLLPGGGYQLEEIDLSGFDPLPPQE